MRKVSFFVALSIVVLGMVADPAFAGRRRHKCCCTACPPAICPGTFPVGKVGAAPPATSGKQKTALQEEKRFTPISLAAIANAPLDHLLQPPSGRLTFNEIPFDLPASHQVFRTEGINAVAPASGKFQAEVPHPLAVHILLSGAWVKREFNGKQVGVITLRFDDGAEVIVPVTAWLTIRETWAYNNDILQPGSEGNAKLVNVLTEAQDRGGPATAFLDMLVIDLGRTKVANSLSSISIRDTSRETVDDIAPSLIVSGITVQHLPPGSRH